METLSIFLMSLGTLFFYGGNAAQFTIANRCSYTVWPGLLTGSGSILPTTGFELPSQRQASINIPAPWSGRIWGRTGCGTQAGRFQCATGDCGSGQLQCNNAGGAPPASLAEFTLATNGGQDFFDVSLVDGFNVPLSIAPQGGAGGCSATTCSGNVNAVCPPELAVRGAGGVIGCKSACVAFNQPQYCCSGAFGTPDKCPPTNYSRIFKQQCPQAYSYAYDDKTSTFTCSGAPNYVVTFCP